jgi:hypothetical protein
MDLIGLLQRPKGSVRGRGSGKCPTARGGEIRFGEVNRVRREWRRGAEDP